MKTKNTSWTFDGQSVLDPDGVNVCTKANGHLISAAPELLALAMRIKDLLWDDDTDPDLFAIAELEARVTEAIEKAAGVCPAKNKITGWRQNGVTIEAPPGYNARDYFDAAGKYLGPDAHGVEPIFEVSANT